MLTPEESALLQRHVSIDGDGNVIGNDNTVQVNKVDAETYVAEVKDQRVTFTVQDLRRIHVEGSQVGFIGDNAVIHGGIQFIKKVITSPWAVGLLAVGVVLLGVIALANLPGAREQLPLWLQPRAFPKEREDEVLIVIAQFYTTEGVVDTAAHDEIKRAIEREAGDLHLRVEVAPTSLKADDREGAQVLGNRYDASIVIWGADTGVRVSVNFYNRKQPEADAANVKIEETAYTQIAAPSEYAEFVTQELPQQLTFLALFAVGQSYYTEESYAESARMIEKAIAVLEAQADIIEGAAEAYFRLGWLYQEPLEESDEARIAYTRALDLNPELASAYNNRGFIYNEMGKYEQALADYTQALALAPEYAKLYSNRGVTYTRMGEYKEAVEDYTRAIELDPELAEAYGNRGNTYTEMGEYEQALADHTRAIELAPEFAAAYCNRGNTYTRLGEYEEAVGDYTRAIELDPELAEAYGNRGNTYGKMGKYEQALADYTHALELDPEDATAYYNRGITYCEMGEYEQALTDYTQAIELDPELAEVYLNRGTTYTKMGEYEQALANYTRAIELAPEFANAYYYGSITHAHLEHTTEACAWLEEALTLIPHWREYAQNDEGFDPVRDAPCFQALMNDSE